MYQNWTNNKFNQQKDGVSMSSSLGSVLANIIMTELEDVIIKPLIADGTIKFYSQFVDDTLLLMKPENVTQVHKAHNKCDKNLRFTVDILQNKAPHFLDLELSPEGITIFRKDTNTGLYVNFASFAPWAYYTSCIRRLAKHVSVFAQQINCHLKSTSLKDLLINKTLNTLSITVSSNDASETNNGVTIYFCAPYYGNKGCSLNKAYICQINSNCKKEQSINFRVLYDTTKINFFCSTKDKIKCQH